MKDEFRQLQLTQPGPLMGAALLALGVLFLLGNFGLLDFAGRAVIASLFGAAGAGFAFMFHRNSAHWWALIPAGVLGGVGLTIALAGTPLAGGALLFTLGLAFVVLHLTSDTRWWALIPGGVLSTIALVTVSGPLAGPVLFGGFALTFGFLGLLRPNARWALIPAVVFASIGGLVFAASLLKWLLPLALIGAGVVMLRPEMIGLERRPELPWASGRITKGGR